MTKILNTIKDTAFLLRNLSEKEQDDLCEIKDLNLLPGKELELLKKLMKQKKAKIKWKNMGLSFFTREENKVPMISGNDDLNNKISSKITGQKFRLFSEKVWDVLPKLISPEIVGMDDVKKAAALQLFSTERFHILLLGDPGTKPQHSSCFQQRDSTSFFLAIPEPVRQRYCALHANYLRFHHSGSAPELRVLA